MARVTGWLPSHPERRIGIRTAILYVAVGGLWIIGSDRVLEWILPDGKHDLYVRAQTYKGIFYVFVTGCLLFALVTASVRKLLEKERSRAESEHWFRFLLDHMGEAVFAFRLGEDGRPLRFFEANDQACRLTQRSRGELLESDPGGIGFPDFAQLWDGVVSDLQEGGQASRTVPLGSTEGSQRLVEAHFQRFHLQGSAVIALIVLDITDRIELETSVASSEASSRFVMEQASDAVVISDENGRVLTVNPKGAEMLGSSADRIRGTFLHDFAHPEDRVGSEGGQERDLSAWTGLFEARVTRRDGTAIDAEISATRLMDGRTLSIIRDVTARKRQIEDDRRKRAHAESLARTASRLNAELDHVMVQRTICEETAAALQFPIVWIELENQRTQRLELTYGVGIPPDHVSVHGGITRAEEEDLLVRGGGSPTILDVRQPDVGEISEFLHRLGLRIVVRAEMRRTGKLVGTLNAGGSDRSRSPSEHEMSLFQAMADLAAQAITNARLYEENVGQLRTLNTLYAGARALSRSLDRDTVAANAARTCVDVFGGRIAWLGLAHPDGTVRPIAAHPETLRERFVLQFRWDDTALGSGPTGRAIKTGQPELIPQIPADVANPFWRDMAMSLGLVSGLSLPLISKDRAIGALSLYSDRADFFTPDKVEMLQAYSIQVAVALESAVMHGQLQEYANRLEERVAERTAQIQETNAALESFAAAVSHDLRAPLRAIQGFALALISDHAERLGDEGREYATRIAGAADRLDAQIQDLLVYSRLSKGDLRMRTVSMDRVVHDVLTHLESEVRASGAEVTATSPLPEVRGDAHVLAQILGNLVSNALKFVAPGTRPRVRVDWRKSDGWTRIEVRDNGIGIAPEDLERIFGIYERLHGIETYPGTGLGLAIARKGVDRMGGRIGVQSTPGGGSAFWIELPDLDVECAESSPEAGPEDDRARGVRKAARAGVLLPPGWE